MTLEPRHVGILSGDDSRTGLVRDTDDAFADWRSVSDTSQTKTDHPAPTQSEVARPAQPREISFEGTLRINGYAAGVIRSATGTLIVEAAGEVDADISVHDATIYGCVRGDIRTKQKVELGASARVVGDIETVALSIEPGAVFEGRCVFLPGDDPTDRFTEHKPTETTLAANS